MNALRLSLLAIAFGLVNTLPVIAADLPVKAPAVRPTVVPVSYPMWSGFYLGAHAGWARVEEERTEVFDPSGGFPSGFRFCCDRDGFIGGVQGGYNWQTGNWVWGVEGDWSWTDSRRQVISTSTINGETRTSFAQ